jgi:hypothetical protein
LAAILLFSAFLTSRKINNLRLHYSKLSVINRLQLYWRAPVLQIRSRHMPVLEAGESPLHLLGSIRVSRLEKLNHGVGFGRTILNRVMGEDDAMDQEHSLALLGLNTNVVVYEDGTGGRTCVGKKLLLRYRRAHGFLACSISTDSKSGQFKVRTPLSQNPNSGRFLAVCQEV